MAVPLLRVSRTVLPAAFLVRLVEVLVSTPCPPLRAASWLALLEALAAEEAVQMGLTKPVGLAVWRAFMATITLAAAAYWKAEVPTVIFWLIK